MRSSYVEISFIELNARERARNVLDSGTFREILNPFERYKSPHLSQQSIVPQSDDGVVVVRGLIHGQSAVVIAIEGGFQGGGIGEVSGAKIAGALENALHDCENGILTLPILILETGGVRLQEGNYGLLAIAEIGAAIVALRRHVPVIGIIAGMIGCYGGMSICAGLCSYLIMTKQGRLELNGPEVIEQEAGIAEFDSSDRLMIWRTVGGQQRCAVSLADMLADDSVDDINEFVRVAIQQGIPQAHRSSKVEHYLSLLARIDPSQSLDGDGLRQLWDKVGIQNSEESMRMLESKWNRNMHSGTNSRGRTWFEALAGVARQEVVGAPSVLCADGMLANENVRYIAVVPNPDNRFPRARHGEVGIDEAWAIARFVQDAIKQDAHGMKRAIVAIIDVPSQAFGYMEELLGINHACAAAVDAYASARLAGHPVIALIVGKAISGAFLAHGLQANRIIAFDDPEVMVQVMSKNSAARITRRTIAELDEAALTIPATAYDIRSFATLGALDNLIEGINTDSPESEDLERVREIVVSAIVNTRSGCTDIANRLQSAAARINRAASIRVRERLAELWN
ncbi:MAG: biotin-independent malonate decarboxylase subunit beta [Paenibacillaceae bacterium]